MLRFTFTIDPGEAQFDKAFSRFSGGLDDYTDLWIAVSSDFERIEKQQFDSEGQSGSGGWVPLSEKYAAEKAKKYPGAKILHATNALNNALTDAGAGGALRVIEPTFMIRGVDLNVIPYAIYHQSKAPRKQLPRRPPIQLSDADKKRWSQMCHAYLVNKARQTLKRENVHASAQYESFNIGEIA